MFINPDDYVTRLYYPKPIYSNEVVDYRDRCISVDKFGKAMRAHKRIRKNRRK